jgi:hypothetical protein
MIVTSTLLKLRHAEGLSKEVLSNSDTFSGEVLFFPSALGTLAVCQQP